MSGTVSEECVRDYFLYKAYDIISCGAYKKLVVKNKEANEPWAMELYAKVQCVTAFIKGVLHQVEHLHEYGKEKLQTVCSEVLAHVNPPCRVKSCWNTCFISGIRSCECLDLTRPGRSEAVITLHRKFSHFVVMLWFVAKFEHVCKVIPGREPLPCARATDESPHGRRTCASGWPGRVRIISRRRPCRGCVGNSSGRTRSRARCTRRCCTRTRTSRSRSSATGGCPRTRRARASRDDFLLLL